VLAWGWEGIVTKTRITDTQTFAPGEVILYPGVPGPKEPLMRVREGLVRIQNVDDDGNTLTLRFVRPGEFFGEEALVGAERRYFAEAVTHTAIDTYDPKNLGLEEFRELTVHMIGALNQTYRRIERLVSQRLKNRIAAALIEFSDTAVAERSPEGQTVIRLTHDELAAAVGSVRETVTKVVGELFREGYIRSGYGKITILDRKGLEALAKVRE